MLYQHLCFLNWRHSVLQPAHHIQVCTTHEFQHTALFFPDHPQLVVCDPKQFRAHLHSIHNIWHCCLPWPLHRLANMCTLEQLLSLSLFTHDCSYSAHVLQCMCILTEHLLLPHFSQMREILPAT